MRHFTLQMIKSLICCTLVLHMFSSVNAQNVKHRVIVLTDIEADPDDTQSLIRLLLYSNNMDIKGLVATTSTWQKSVIAPESIHRLIEAYGKVQPNLIKHESGYPEPKALSDMVKKGLPVYGMKGVGEGKDSEGSEWIIKILEEADDRPLWISIWGGSNTLAQALYKIRKSKAEKEAQKLIAKLRVYAISDQDDSGIWIRNQFPDLFYIVSPGDHYVTAIWSGIHTPVSGISNETISNSWLAENIQQAHGPLGALYPDVAYGMEGDTPSFLSLITNGLNEPEHPDWGGWGGRYEYYQPDFRWMKKGDSDVPLEAEIRKIWTDGKDHYALYMENSFGRSVKQDTFAFSDNKVTLWRWRDDFQNDFAARMDWCFMSFEEANHPPLPSVVSDRLTVHSGATFSLSAEGSSDPDGDNLSFLWFHYPEAGSYKKQIRIDSAENLKRVNIIAPKVEKEETAHFIVKVSDKGSPRLSRYKRVIVTIVP